MDYQTEHYIGVACASFGRLILWHDPNGNPSHVLVRVWLMDEALVPRSLIVRQVGGANYSWTVPTYLLRGFGAQVVVGLAPWVMVNMKEPPPPKNGNPHPFDGHVLTVVQ